MSKLSQGAKRNKRKVDDRMRRRNMTDKEWANKKALTKATKKKIKAVNSGRVGHNPKARKIRTTSR